MRHGCWMMALVASLILLGCDSGPRPKTAATPGPDGPPQEVGATKLDPHIGLPHGATISPPALKAVRKTVTPGTYQGWTAEQWWQAFNTSDVKTARWASQALKTMGHDGRDYLMKGLESPNPVTRRMALKTMTVAEIRSYGEQGRQVLVKLAGDRDDGEVRERAALYLSQWREVVPAP